MAQPRDMLDEMFSDAQRKLWEAWGLLNAARLEAEQQGFPGTAERCEETIAALAQVLDTRLPRARKTYHMEHRSEAK